MSEELLDSAKIFENESAPVEQFDAEIVTFIQLGRIYDVLMMLLSEANPSAANDLLEVHMSGALMGPQPSFNGLFISDSVNDETTGADPKSSE